MRLCKCGGKLASHELTPTEKTVREAWSCESCKRYQILEKEKIEIPAKPSVNPTIQTKKAR